MQKEAASAEYAAVLARLQALKLASATGNACVAQELRDCARDLAAAKQDLYAAGLLRRRGNGKQPTAGLLRRACFGRERDSPFSFVVHSPRHCHGATLQTKVSDYRAVAANLERAGPLVVATPDTDSLRRLSRLHTTRRDRVLEIGCSYGACSTLICDAQPDIFVGLDNSEECVQACIARNLNGCSPVFRRFDCLLEREALRQLLIDINPTLVVVDVGGIRGLADVVELIELLVASLHPQVSNSTTQLLLVKSEQLVAEAVKSTAVVVDWEKQESDGVLERVIACPVGWWEAIRHKIDTAEAELLMARADRSLRPATSYPMREVPSSGGLFICRHHNYSPHGCTTTRPGGCQYNHTLCHCCLEEGHIAISGCTKFGS